MISSQPLVVQVTSGNQFIVASVPDNANDPAVTQATPDDPDDAPHTTYEDYNSVYSSGSNSAGQMTYYATDTYSQAYYNAGGVNLTDAYMVIEPTAANNDPSMAVSSNSIPAHRESSQNVLSDEEYNKSFQQTRMSVQPQTISWLMQNYETADGVSLPRSTLYSHYQQHCTQNNIEPVNAASFGKLIRSVFVGLRTRRLGTRGNSKYHYYGIRIKPGSSLGRISDGVNGGGENSTMPPVKRAKVNNNVTSSKSNANESQHVLPTPLASSPEQLLTYLGDATELLNSVWPSSQSSEEHDESQKVLHTFTKIYRAHYDKIIKALSTLNFQDVESIWHAFWQCTAIDSQSPDYLSIDCVKGLTKTTFADWIAQTDYTMYNAIISNLLLPNLLKPIPQILTQQIRNFAKCINKWMATALHGYDDEFLHLKTAAVSALSHMLRRYTSLNHLSTAACAVLKNQQQVSQMITDLNKVDFKNVQEQASWVCECDDEIVRRVESSFKTFLQDPNPQDKWAGWCEKVLHICLPDDTTAKQFFFKWEFYSSLVMRDLTLRSAASFGSFHLIRLLYDEYIFYLIEQRIAKSTRTTPLQMLGESRSLGVTGHLETPTNSANAPVNHTETLGQALH